MLPLQMLVRGDELITGRVPKAIAKLTEMARANRTFLRNIPDTQTQTQTQTHYLGLLSIICCICVTVY